MARKKKRKWLKKIALLTLVLIAVIAAIFYLIQKQPSAPVTKPDSTMEDQRPQISPPSIPPEREESRQPSQHKQLPDTAVKDKETALPAPVKNRVAIIIDDIGNNLSPVRELLKIDAPITFAILPHLKHSVDCAEMLKKAGREISLHLPMEPHNYPTENPGAGALFTSMDENEINRQLIGDIKAVPYAVGINNHMGSKYMENEKFLSIIFKTVKKRGLFFVDSRTTSKTKGKILADKIGVDFAARDVFIDNEQSFDATYKILVKTSVNFQNGEQQILIGHPYPSTIKALMAAVPVFKEKGIVIVPVSQLVKKAKS